VTDLVVGVVAVLGGIFVLLAGVGTVRFGDLYARMHAATKASTIGILLVAIAGAVAIDGGAAKSLLAAVVIFVTAPAAAHFVGRAAYRAEGVDYDVEAADDLAAALDETEVARPDERP
jgi:multicomponent Na+:H+ antiporter subunit G